MYGIRYRRSLSKIFYVFNLLFQGASGEWADHVPPLAEVEFA